MSENLKNNSGGLEKTSNSLREYLGSETEFQSAREYQNRGHLATRTQDKLNEFTFNIEWNIENTDIDAIVLEFIDKNDSLKGEHSSNVIVSQYIEPSYTRAINRALAKKELEAAENYSNRLYSIKHYNRDEVGYAFFMPLHRRGINVCEEIEFRIGKNEIWESDILSFFKTLSRNNYDTKNLEVLASLSSSPNSKKLSTGFFNLVKESTLKRLEDESIDNTQLKAAIDKIAEYQPYYVSHKSKIKELIDLVILSDDDKYLIWDWVFETESKYEIENSYTEPNQSRVMKLLQERIDITLIEHLRSTKVVDTEFLSKVYSDIMRDFQRFKINGNIVSAEIITRLSEEAKDSILTKLIMH